MFAAQLLRILETIPSDVKYDTCVFDPAEQDITTMKENQKTTLYDPKSFEREPDPEEIYHLNGPRRNGCWNPFVDDFSTDSENGTRDSPGKEEDHQNEDSLSPDSNENESPYIETNANSYTDKIVLECAPPELIVRYKEINYHIVKDICVDEGMPVKDDQSGRSFSESLSDDDSHCESTELVISEGLTDLSTNNKEDDVLITRECSKSSSESYFGFDTAKHCGPEGSFIDKTLPFQEFGTRSFLRSFLHSLDEQGNKVEQPPDQISSGKAVSENNPDSSSAEGKPNQDVQTNCCLHYNSNVENGTITFDFKSPALVPAGITNNEITENAKAQDFDSGKVHMPDHKDEKVEEQSLNIKNDLSNDLSAPSQDECREIKNEADENVHDRCNSVENVYEPPFNVKNDFSAPSQVDDEKNVHDHKDENCDDHLCDDAQARNSISSDCQTVEHEHKNLGLITYSGPIAYSGSLSVRSDGSAASSRSFAFPILQSEWNSSPVRMAKADGGDFRKHKGWRSGLLCCRF